MQFQHGGPLMDSSFSSQGGGGLGTGNDHGEPIAIAEADSHVAGFCLLNDWSARDIQGWYSQP